MDWWQILDRIVALVVTADAEEGVEPSMDEEELRNATEEKRAAWTKARERTAAAAAAAAEGLSFTHDRNQVGERAGAVLGMK